jgi:hypothetical protein
MIKIFVTIILCSVSFIVSTSAQDTIRTNKDTLLGKVVEIGIDAVKYFDAKNQTGPLIVISKDDVLEIRYENGSRFLIKQDPYDVNKIVNVRKKNRSIKFEFLSPMTNDIAFAYESMISVGKNIEFKIGIIGPGFAETDGEKGKGVFVKGGMKFLTSPQYYTAGMKYLHGLHGTYIKPEIIFNSYTRNKPVYSSAFNGQYWTTSAEMREISYTNLCLDIVVGKQFILGNILTFEYYFGVGFGMRASNYDDITNFTDYENDSEFYSYSHLYLGNNIPMIITAGITLGVIY